MGAQTFKSPFERSDSKQIKLESLVSDGWDHINSTLDTARGDEISIPKSAASIEVNQFSVRDERHQSSCDQEPIKLEEGWFSDRWIPSGFDSMLHDPAPVYTTRYMCDLCGSESPIIRHRCSNAIDTDRRKYDICFECYEIHKPSAGTKNETRVKDESSLGLSALCWYHIGIKK